MENNEEKEIINSILNKLQTIKKKQVSLKKSLGEINKFIKAKFNSERKEEEKKLNEFSLNINKELSNKLEKYKKDLLKEVKPDSTKLTQLKEDTEYSKSFDKNNLNIEEENENENTEKEDQKENKNYSLEFLSEDIILEYDVVKLESMNRLNFKVKIRNNGEANIPKGTMFKLEKKDEIFKIEYLIDELGISEEKEFNISIYINEKKEDFKEKYSQFESNLIVCNDNHSIKCNPLKFKFIIKNNEKNDQDSETVNMEERFSNHNSEEQEKILDDSPPKNEKKEVIDPYKDMKDEKPIKINENDFQKIKKSLDEIYNICSFKDDNYIKKKITKFGDIYLKYQNSQKKDEKEQVLKELVDKIGELFFAESEYVPPKGNI
jgi:hypothetical protein